MIHSLTGTILEIPQEQIVLDTGHNCAYVFYALDVDRVLGASGRYYVHFHLRQDHLSLYGFKEQAQCELFKTLLLVKGIGPKTALNILNKSSYKQLRKAIAQSDETLLLAIPGIGKRMASQIVLDLKGKIQLEEQASLFSYQDDVFDSLIAMGYTQIACKEAYLKVSPASHHDDKSLLLEMLRVLKEASI